MGVRGAVEERGGGEGFQLGCSAGKSVLGGIPYLHQCSNNARSPRLCDAPGSAAWGFGRLCFITQEKT